MPDDATVAELRALLLILDNGRDFVVLSLSLCLSDCEVSEHFLNSTLSAQMPLRAISRL